MHISIATALSAATLVSGAAIKRQNVPSESVPLTSLFPALPLSIFEQTAGHTLTLEEAIAGVNLTEKINDLAGKVEDKVEDTLDNLDNLIAPNMKVKVAAAAATCSTVRVRQEWDSVSTSDRQNFVDALKCLMGKAPSGQFAASKSRYEDFVALHQTLTPRVHQNAKFLLWHRYYLWTFEQILRDDCGFTGPLPWFDETKYAGKFSQSSIFSSQWMGGIALNGNCVTDGQFANLAINVGPGTGNQPHCLARNGDSAKTINTGQSMVDACNSRATFADMASCSEGGAHAWGHNGIGAVMLDVYGSPADPTFWLHHGFIDRNFRIWQNQNAGVRTTTIDGNDIDGNALTLDNTINVYDFRPDVKIRDILDTAGPTLCYKYNY
ncbi:Tyrosinase [Ascochyta rabiei]|uniref:Metal ion binding n=1 Tax=Didymella rabiei TaxID=5454 RepID=A0A163ELR8_DIDRA|nr:Tyrosinase [Ascochyta rabiei]KZM23764.1 metal ion binding [Ascochyta rabiei]UPX10257.1 Tyrosinase [Ascochyta rabiei]